MIDNSNSLQLIYSSTLGLASTSKPFELVRNLMDVMFRKIEVVVEYTSGNDNDLFVTSSIEIYEHTVYEIKDGNISYQFRLEKIKDNNYKIISSQNIPISKFTSFKIFIPEHVFGNYESNDTFIKFDTEDEISYEIRFTNKFSITSKYYDIVKMVDAMSSGYTTSKHPAIIMFGGGVIACMIPNNTNDITYAYTQIIRIIHNDNNSTIMSARANDIMNNSILSYDDDIVIRSIYQHTNQGSTMTLGVRRINNQDSNMRDLNIVPSIVNGYLVRGMYFRLGNWNTESSNIYNYDGIYYFSPHIGFGLNKLWIV